MSNTKKLHPKWVFCSICNLNTWAILAIWNFNAHAILRKIYFAESGGNTPREMTLLGILTYSSLFSQSTYLILKLLHWPEWSQVFHRVWHVWKWSPVQQCTYEMFWKMLASSLFPQNNASALCFWRIRAALPSKRAVHLSANNFCRKWYTFTLVIYLSLLETHLKSEKYK